MNKPQKPNKPHKPSEPIPPTQTVEKPNTVIEIEEENNLDDLISAMGLRENLSLDDLKDFSIYSDFCVWRDVDIFYLKHNKPVTVPNENYEHEWKSYQKDLKKYPKQCQKYEERLLEYHQKMLVYEQELAAYNKHVLDEERKLYEKLKEKFA